MRNLEDIAWITQAAIFHNRAAFGRLVEKYQAQVRRFFLSQTLGDTQLSDDLAQDTFVKAYLNISRFRGEASFSTWLFRIAYNAASFTHLRPHDTVLDYVCRLRLDKKLHQKHQEH